MLQRVAIGTYLEIYHMRERVFDLKFRQSYYIHSDLFFCRFVFVSNNLIITIVY